MDDNVYYKLFFIFIFLLNIHLSISALFFTFPISTTLTNGNIFVIHQNGISVCNSGVTKIIKNSYTFNEDEKISKDILVNVTITQFNDGFIIALIKDKLYFFDSNGDYLDKSENFLSHSNVYISISSYKTKSNRYYFFLIGYIYNKLLYLYYYKYDSQEKAISTVATATGLYDKYGSSTYNIENNGVACKIVYKNSKDIIECVYFMKKSSSYSYVSLALLYINNQNILTYKNTIHYEYKNIMFLSSAVNNDFSQAFYCFYDIAGTTTCKYYDHLNDKGLVWTLNEKCSINNYGINTYYFPDTEEFSISCLLSKGGIGFVFFNKKIEQVTRYEYKYTDCTQIISHSLLYSINKEKFYVLS